MSNWVYDKWMEPKVVKTEILPPETAQERAYRDPMYFAKNFLLGEWPINDAVYSREEVEKMVNRGEISPARADELLRLRYDEERSVGSVAKTLDRPIDGVYKALSRIRLALYTCMNRRIQGGQA